MKSVSSGDHYCVTGAGIIGSWTALNLVREGYPTLLIEQYPNEEGRGSSQGGSRAFRMMDNVDLSALIYSMEEWKKLEGLTGSSLFVKTGLINLGLENDRFLMECFHNLQKWGYPIKWIDPAQLKERFPQVHYPGSYALYDENAGILRANECLRSVKEEYTRLGGKFLHAEVRRIRPADDDGGVVVDLRDNNGRKDPLRVKKAVVCAGPWTSKLFPQFQPVLRTKAIPVTYWQEIDSEGKPVIDGQKAVYSYANDFPVIFNARYTNVYAIPSFEYPGMVKVLYHGGPDAEPGAGNEAAIQPYIDYVRDYVREHFPVLDYSKPSILEKCMYTCTPDNQPVIDTMNEGIVIGTGFSGSGFKHSPAMGRSLALMALDRENEIPSGFEINKMKLRRF